MTLEYINTMTSLNRWTSLLEIYASYVLLFGWWIFEIHVNGKPMPIHIPELVKAGFSSLKLAPS